MPVDSTPCPSCGQSITPRPRRARKCPHCGRQLLVRGGQLITAGDAPAAALPSPPPPPTASPAEGVRQVVAEVLRELGVLPDETARFARCKSFGSELSPREAAFAQALEFATQLGPANVISISHAEDDRGSVVTVWYWAPAYEVQSEGPA